MRKLRALQAAGIALLLGLCWWKNWYSYRQQSTIWRLVKSVADCSLIVLVAQFIPGMLVAWAVLLVTRPIKSEGLRITVAVVTGIFFGAISGVALEVLCAFSAISIDLVTGANGIWGKWKQGPPDSFLSSLNEARRNARGSTLEDVTE